MFKSHYGKRIISTLMAFVLCFALAPTIAFGATIPTAPNGLSATLSGTTLTVNYDVANSTGVNVTTGVYWSYSNANPTSTDNPTPFGTTIADGTASATYSPVILGIDLSKTQIYYVAYATNNEGTVTSLPATFTLPVQPTPTISINTPTITYNSNGTITITSTYTTAGSYSVSTYGAELRVGTFTGAIPGTSLTSTQLSATTIIENNLTNGQTYQICMFATSDGSTKIRSTEIPYTYYLPFVAPTVSASTITTSKTTSTTAEASFGVSNVGSGIKAVGVVYGTSSLPQKGSLNFTEVASTSAGSGVLNLSGLTPGQLYYARAYTISSNATNTLTYGGQTSFTTLSTSTVPTVTTVSIDNKKDVSADVSATAAAVGGSAIAKRGVVYSTSNGTLTTSNSKVESTSTNTAFSVSLTGLTQNTTYYTCAYAINAKGETAYGGKLSFTTNSTSSSSTSGTASTTAYAATNITSTTADVEITTSTTGDDSSITERGIVYSTSNSSPTVGGTSCERQTVSGTTGAVTVTLTGLTRETTYYMKSYVKDANGIAYSAVKTFKTTYEDKIPQISTDTVSVLGGTTAEVDIYVTTDNGYAISKRGVIYSKTVSNPKISDSNIYSETITGEKGTGNTLLSGLSPQTKYYVRAFATNTNGTGYGAVKTFTTEKTSTDVVTIAPTNITVNTATLWGRISSSINSNVIERGVCYSTSRAAPTLSDYYVKSTVTAYGDYSVNVSSLQSNVKYYVRAYAKTSDGTTYGETYTFTTTNNTDIKKITVTYTTTTGAYVGTQTISVPYGSIITEKGLTLPTGATLVTPTFSYSVNDNASITIKVFVSSANTGTVSSTSAFMQPYYPTLFEPERKATRMEVMRLLYNLKGNPSVSVDPTFSDMPTSADDIAAVKYVYSMGYFEGDGNGKLRPYSTMTRAEIIKVLNLVYSYTSTSSSTPFSDISSHWAKDYIVAGYDNGALKGYPDGTFKPDRNMTRAEVATIFARGEKRTEPISTKQFADVPADYYAYKYIMSISTPN